MSDFNAFARIFLASIFVVALIQFARDRPGFVSAAVALAPRSLRGTRIFAAILGVLVILEGAVVTLILLPGRNCPTTGFAIAVGLLAIFTYAIFRAVRQSADVPCHCFGAGTETVTALTIVRNLVFLLVAAGGLWAAMTSPRFPPIPIFIGWIGPAVATSALCMNGEMVVRVLLQPIEM